MSDFYRPFSVPALFELVFPGDYYAIKVSEFRVHQAIKRLRAVLKKNKIPLTIESDGTGYRLSATTPYTLLLSTSGELKSAEDSRIEQLRTEFPKPFSVTEAALLLGVSRRTVTELLKQGVEKGTIQRIGTGPNVRYQILPSDRPEMPLAKVGT